MTAAKPAAARVRIPRGRESAVLRLGRRSLQLTNLEKVFWPELELTKRDLLQYYADVAPVLLPHLRDRAMVMKRYPNGIHGKCFFMKRTPSPWPRISPRSSGW
jgi:bifunctional non-homologous end joining protein LigD